MTEHLNFNLRGAIKESRRIKKDSKDHNLYIKGASGPNLKKYKVQKVK